jgi:hypothetical protein
MSNLLKLLQPKEYKSKIKLYCKDSEFIIKKYNNSFGDVENKSYISRIKILEI